MGAKPTGAKAGSIYEVYGMRMGAQEKNQS